MKHDPFNGLHKRLIKGKKYQDQFRATFQGFMKPCTMKELSVRIRIDRSNICWYVRDMRQNKSIAVIKKVICSITKHRANLYTTNPDLMPKPAPTLFDL